LKEGDRFIPLAAGVHNGYTGTAAAVIAYNSDLKGSLILSAFAERDSAAPPNRCRPQSCPAPL
jgi:hypothetical protein